MKANLATEISVLTAAHVTVWAVDASAKSSVVRDILPTSMMTFALVLILAAAMQACDAQGLQPEAVFRGSAHSRFV